MAGLDVLVRRYQRRALQAAYLVTGDLAQAEDLVQAAFVRVYERIEQFDAERPFGPWFLRIVVNDAIKSAARQGRQVSLDTAGREDVAVLSDLLADPHPGPEAAVETDELRQAVWRALQQLSPEQRGAIVERYFLGLSESSMAERAQRPPGTIKWRLHAARERLRELLLPWNTIDSAAGAAHPAPAATAEERHHD